LSKSFSFQSQVGCGKSRTDLSGASVAQTKAHRGRIAGSKERQLRAGRRKSGSQLAQPLDTEPADQGCSKRRQGRSQHRSRSRTPRWRAKRELQAQGPFDLPSPTGPERGGERPLIGQPTSDRRSRAASLGGPHGQPAQGQSKIANAPRQIQPTTWKGRPFKHQGLSSQTKRRGGGTQGRLAQAL